MPITKPDSVRLSVLRVDSTDFPEHTHSPVLRDGSIELIDNNHARSNSADLVGSDNDLERNLSNVTAPVEKMTIHNPPRNIYRTISFCIWTFSCGYSDSAPGALLPFIERHYGINYAVVSLIWMANAIGFILVAASAHKIQPWFGRQYSLLIGCFLSIIQYAIVSSGSHFALIVVGFGFGGAGLGIVLAQCNVFLANLDKSTLYLSFNHAGYGLGATISPLLATLMITKGGVKWNYVYLINLGLMIINFFLLGYAFKGADEDLKPWDHKEEVIVDGQPVQSASRGSMKEALKNHITWLLALLIMFYQGSEVSMGGWCVTYLIDYKGGDINSIGYVASAFWFGLTMGRLLLTHPAYKLFGARRSLLIMCLLTLLVVILSWVLPHVIAASAFVAVAGVWIGPAYSLIVGTSVKPGMLPRKIQIVSTTIITAFGSLGGALFPLIIGLIGESVGSYVLFPVFICLYSLMIVLWLALPNIERVGKQTNLWQRIW